MAEMIINIPQQDEYPCSFEVEGTLKGIQEGSDCLIVEAASKNHYLLIQHPDKDAIFDMLLEAVSMPIRVEGTIKDNRLIATNILILKWERN